MKRFSEWWEFAVLAVVVPCMLVGGIWFYRIRREHTRRDAEEMLNAIVTLKTDQIVRWRAGLLRDVSATMNDSVLIETVTRWRSAPDANAADRLPASLRFACRCHDFFDALLVDPGGQVLLSVGGSQGLTHEETVTTVITALREGRALLSPLHAGPSGLPPHIDVVAPWLPPDGTEPKVLGAMVFRCNLRQFLYPLIQSWPTPSASAESLLVRRDGEAVLFLNDLRYQKDTALKLRIPLGCKDLPAALAAQGREGIVQGPDYRGVGVLAAVKAVPESPWFVVAKIDAAEVFAGWHLESALIVGLIGGTLIATMVTAAAVC